MYQLERLSLNNWYLIEGRDFEIRGATGIVGATGAGKSSFLDAIQTVITGNNQNYLDLNASTEGKSDRKVLDYCLGLVSDISDEVPQRERCETTLVMTFRDIETGKSVAVGLMLRSDIANSREDLKARFVAHGLSFKMTDFSRAGEDGRTYVLSHDEMLHRMKADRDVKLEVYNSSSTSFVEGYLQAMRRKGAVPNIRHFLGNFQNMVAFRPVEDPTKFVRHYILHPDPINVDRIRSRIAYWREMSETVQKLVQMLAEITTIKNRFRTWGRQKNLLNSTRFLHAYAERRRLEIEHAQEADKLNGIRQQLETDRKYRADRQGEIDAMRREVLAKKALIAASGVGAKMQAIESRIAAARVRISEATAQLAKRAQIAVEISELSRLRNHVPISLHAALEAAAALAEVMHAARLRGREQELDELDGRARAITGAEASLRAQEDALVTEQSRIADEISEIETRIAAAGSEGAVLSRPVRHFRDLLARTGIDSQALPDMVEIADPRWAMALESLLGPNREAILVEAHHQRAAFDLLYRHRNEHGLHQCRLIHVSRMDRIEARAEPGSIAHIVETGHPLIRKFIDHHVGRVRMVEAESELDHHAHAVMMNGKTSGGLSLRVFADLVPILGRTARSAALAADQSKLEGLRSRRADLAKNIGDLRQAAATITRIKLDETPVISTALLTVATAEAEIRSAETDRKQVEDEETKGLRTEIESIEQEIKAYEDELASDITPAISKNEDEERNLDVKVRSLFDKIETERTNENSCIAVEEENKVLIGLLDQPETIAVAQAKLDAAAFHHHGNERAALAGARNTAAREIDDLARNLQQNERRAPREFADFLQKHDIENPLPQDADNTAMFSWLILREKQLQENELLPNQAALDKACQDFENALREDLLAKLADKFEAMKTQIKVLNARLMQHRFTGMRYYFTYSVDPRLAKLHAFATEIATNPHRTFSYFTEAAAALPAGSDADVALKQIDELINNHKDASALDDYRNYFTYEINMERADGTKSTLSFRAKKGSGGQKQAPFYVAIGAAMAAVYYPGSRGPSADGMGLVLFDEAFNKLDSPNTKAVLQFYRELNLQVVIAAPQDKRLTFLETMDTLVTVSRREGNENLHVAAEHLTEFARSVMQDTNPEYRGIDAFRLPSAAASAPANAKADQRAADSDAERPAEAAE